ncbi:MAG: glycosyltransferase 61 family protein [Sulfitobacter sp.]
MKLASEPRFFWRAVDPAIICGFPASADDEMNQRISGFVAATQKNRQFTKAIEFDTVPALLSHAQFRKSYVLAEEKLLLNGSSGNRLLNQYCRDDADRAEDPEQELHRYFEECRRQNAAAAFAFAEPEEIAGMDFAVECRNTFNYFHFLTESLCQLCVLDQFDFQGTVYFHFPNSEDKQRDFAIGFVEALFPELAGRVVFERAPKDYDKVLTAYDLIGCHFQFPQPETGGIAEYFPEGGKPLVGALGRNTLTMNSFRSSLASLRQRALKAVEGLDMSHLPRRFFVGRDDRHARDRQMDGFEGLYDHLDLFGFQFVVFESMSPLEQIALMVNAEMMISCHGAGFANMLFANHDTWVVELGTYQTATSRWADFWPLAHVAGCRYVSFFADHKQDDPLREPIFAADGIVPVSLSEAGLARVMAFVVSVLGYVPKLANRAELLALSKGLLEAAEPERALAVLDAHIPLLESDVALCLIQADCHKELDEPKQELIALERAVRANPNRWQTLVRMIWCANRCDRPEVVRWALDHLRTDFPKRFEAFTANHDWVHHVA